MAWVYHFPAGFCDDRLADGIEARLETPGGAPLLWAQPIFHGNGLASSRFL